MGEGEVNELSHHKFFSLFALPRQKSIPFPNSTGFYRSPPHCLDATSKKRFATQSRMQENTAICCVEIRLPQGL